MFLSDDNLHSDRLTHSQCQTFLSLQLKLCFHWDYSISFSCLGFIFTVERRQRLETSERNIYESQGVKSLQEKHNSHTKPMRRSPTVSSVIQSRDRKTPKYTKSAGTRTSHRGSSVQNEVAESKLSAVLDTWHRKIHFLMRWIEKLIFESDSQLIIQTKTTFLFPKRSQSLNLSTDLQAEAGKHFQFFPRREKKKTTICQNYWLYVKMDGSHLEVTIVLKLLPVTVFSFSFSL